MGKILNSEQNQEKVGENENMPKAKKKVWEKWKIRGKKGKNKKKRSLNFQI